MPSFSQPQVGRVKHLHRLAVLLRNATNSVRGAAGRAIQGRRHDDSPGRTSVISDYTGLSPWGFTQDYRHSFIGVVLVARIRPQLQSPRHRATDGHGVRQVRGAAALFVYGSQDVRGIARGEHPATASPPVAA